MTQTLWGRWIRALLMTVLVMPAVVMAQSGTAARLQRPMNVNLNPGTVGDLLAAVRGATGLDVALDPAIYLQPDTPVRLQLRNVEAREVLRLGMSLVSQPASPLELVIQDNLALLTTAARADAGARVSKRYNITRLIGNRNSEADDRVRAVASLIRQFIDPSGWSLVGGRTGELRINGRELEIATTPVLHRRIEAFITDLAEALNPSSVRSTSELRFAQQRLETEQTYGYANEPAGEVISNLAVQRLRVNIFANWRVLGNVTITPETLVSIPEQAYTGAAVLDALAASLSTSGAEVVWSLDDSTAIVHLTAVEQLPGANHVIEIYNLTPYLKTSTDMRTYMQRIREEIEPDAWTGIGSGRNIMGDYGNLLVISAAPATHAEVLRLIRTPADE